MNFDLFFYSGSNVILAVMKLLPEYSYENTTDKQYW